MNFVEVNVSELTGLALNFALDTIECLGIGAYSGEELAHEIELGNLPPAYSSSWDKSGPLRDRFKVNILEGDGFVVASFVHPKTNIEHTMAGETALIALCRAIVSSAAEDGKMSIPEPLIAECN